MDNLMEIVFEIRMQMLLGMALSPALDRVLEERTDEFSKNLKIWAKRRVAGHSGHLIFSQLPILVKTPARRAFLMVLERGLMNGSPIDQSLQELQTEFLQTIEIQFEKKLQILPLKLMVPLTTCILPSVMSLIVGPLALSLVTKM